MSHALYLTDLGQGINIQHTAVGLQIADVRKVKLGYGR